MIIRQKGSHVKSDGESQSNSELPPDNSPENIDNPEQLKVTEKSSEKSEMDQLMALGLVKVMMHLTTDQLAATEGLENRISI